MKRRTSDSDSYSHNQRPTTNHHHHQHNSHKQQSSDNEVPRSRPPKIYDNVTRRMLKLGLTLGSITFVGLIVRYAVQEFDPSVGTISVSTTRINNRDVASLSVSKHFLERILGFIEESIGIVACVLPLGFPLCSLLNRRFAKFRAKGVGGAAAPASVQILDSKVLGTIPKYVLIGDLSACQLAPDNSDDTSSSSQAKLRPLLRDTIVQLIRAHMKPKLIVEESLEEARRLGVRVGLIRRNHHPQAVIRSMDLLKIVADSHGEIKPEKVRYLLSRMKILSQATPADKPLLLYLIRHCQPMPNEGIVYLGASFTDPEAMRMADAPLAYADCDDEDVRKQAHALLGPKTSASGVSTMTDLYLFVVVCLFTANITQSYALYQEQLVSQSQFGLLMIIQQVFAILALMTKWLASLPSQSFRPGDVGAASLSSTSGNSSSSGEAFEKSEGKTRRRSRSLAGQTHEYRMQVLDRPAHGPDDTIDSSSSLNSSISSLAGIGEQAPAQKASPRRRSRSEASGARPPASSPARRPQSDVGKNRPPRSGMRSRARSSSARQEQHIPLSGIDLDQALIKSSLVTGYKQTFTASDYVDDVTLRLIKLQIAYQALVMIIIMVFGNAMFQLNLSSSRQHQTLALNSLVLNNVFNLANCFNQMGEFNIRQGFKNHPFFVCVTLMAIFVQVTLTELNAFGLESLNPIQWFVCFVFASLSALIAPLTGQQQRRPSKLEVAPIGGPKVAPR